MDEMFSNKSFIQQTIEQQFSDEQIANLLKDFQKNLQKKISVMKL